MTEPTLKAAQADLGRAFIGGATGVFVSGLVWLIAGGVWIMHGGNAAFWALFFGGMAIFPLGLLLAKAVFKAPPVGVGKPLERLGLESTFVLLAGVAVAWALLPFGAERAIAVLAIIVGARYFSFRTLYDELAYWMLSAAFVALGAGALFGFGTKGPAMALAIGAVEVVAAVLIYRRWKRGAIGAGEPDGGVD